MGSLLSKKNPSPLESQSEPALYHGLRSFEREATARISHKIYSTISGIKIHMLT